MNLRTVIFVAIGVAQVVGLILFLNTAGAEAFAVAESLPYVQNTWVWEPLQHIEYAVYILLVPIFFIDLLVYLVVSSVTREKQQVARMRGRL
ncbi:hypothetical protein SAMN04487947_0435 [Halogeometricum rufum]|uniref:Uncharacterized protein n=1 Tax=Halogeometricum rufum TaxID=553469 RepID=A0A1I6G220_9EURY|nr:hypothetical protein [Halogeometricum rufum]MUV57222.1 hypothetical protein [Halogeometricum sp. CBA1124]SFR36226.1 hypothetical protein SAMN04487947_0435 [Halogeometricum rufum]